MFLPGIKYQIKCGVCSSVLLVPRCRLGKRKHCSRACYAKAQSLKKGENSPYFKPNTHVEKNCPTCNKSFVSYVKANKKYCNNKCYSKSLVGSKQSAESIKKRIRYGKDHHNWKGGRVKNGGYILLRMNNPRNHQSKYYPEQCFVVEQIIGRALTAEEEVHHIDYKKDNNDPKNLYLFPSQAEHMRYHGLVKNNLIEPITDSNLSSFQKFQE